MATVVKRAAFIKNLVNAAGKTVRISVVTETDSWKRPQVGADAVEARCTVYVERKLDSLPAGTVEVQMQETIHQSDLDNRGHITIVCKKEDGTQSKEHITTT